MGKNLLIAVAILSGLMLIGYLLAVMPVYLHDQTPTTDTTQSTTNNDRSWLGDMYHAWKVTRPNDDGIRREGSNRPDSDTSECQWQNLSSDQMITTRFAGHILRYPCTANHDGRSSVHYNQANEVVYQNYALYVRVLVRPDRESIWRRTTNDYGGTNDAYMVVKLSSDGEKISNEPIKKWIANATKIAEFQSTNTVVYQNNHIFRGFLIDSMNEQYGYPNILCNSETTERAFNIFDPDRTHSEHGDCDALRNLNAYIRVRIQIPKSISAKNFECLYKKIDQGLRDIIIKEPNGIENSNQED